MPLTDTACRQAKADAKPYKLSDRNGLYLLVNKSGKYWRWDYRFEKKRQTMAFGTYPTVTLAQARDKLITNSRLLDQGTNPMARRKAEVVEASQTFEIVARAWHQHWSPDRSARHAAYVLTRLEQDVFPAIGKQPIFSLQSSAFRDVVKAIESRGALDVAKRVLQTCSQIMRYAVAHDLASRNPVADVRPADVLKSRKKRNYPRVGLNELPELLTKIENYVGSEHTRLALKLIALTFVRTSELIGAAWDEFDFERARWNIPAERMKMKSPHIVPLSTQAIDVLTELKKISFGSSWLFPGDINPSKHMSNNTILFALYRLGYRSRMTGHGFRGVASTYLHEEGWPHEHIELQLAHQSRDDVSAAYNHALYLEPRAKMMQAYAEFLEACLKQST